MGALLRFPSKMALLWHVSNRCGLHIYDKMRLLFFGFCLYVCDRVPINPVFQVVIHLNSRRRPVSLGSFGDYSTLKEVFIERVYELPESAPSKTIIDLGSNIGLAICYFSLRYPGAQIWGFEPDPSNWNRLRENAGAIDGVKMYNVAAAKSNGWANFSIDSHRGTSSGLTDQEKADAIRVETWTLDRVLDESACQEVDLVKFDIEGAEYDMFGAFQGWKRVNTFAGEIHRIDNGQQPEELCALFSSNGFEVRTAEDGESGVLHIIAQRQLN